MDNRLDLPLLRPRCPKKDPLDTKKGTDVVGRALSLHVTTLIA